LLFLACSFASGVFPEAASSAICFGSPPVSIPDY
jgi:hypothetical protein